ncbi:MAG: DUF1097 domain-containing protein [Planctomycetota bacterium]|nr:DUF1097 domain-containing protein [Planctomycetota bacterium]
MTFGQFLIIPLFIAFQAFTLMVIAPYIPGNLESVGGKGLMGWVTFQAWAMYFLAGCTVKMGFKTLAGYLGGIVASVAIFELAGMLSGLDCGDTKWGLYLAVFVVVVGVISAEKVPGFNFVPSWFLGAGVFFALATFGKKPDDVSVYAWYVELGVPELIACALGLVYGYCTVIFRKSYEAKFAVKAAVAAPETAANG